MKSTSKLLVAIALVGSTPKLRPTTLPPYDSRCRYRNRAERSRSVWVEGSTFSNRSNPARVESWKRSMSRNAT